VKFGRSVARGVVILAVSFFGASGMATAANETATNDFVMTPQSGQFFKEAPRPANWRVEVEIKAPYPASSTVLPMKKVSADFPNEMSFNPDPKMPVCEDDKIGPPPVNLTIPPEEAIARCPKSVLGNGTAELYLARNNHANGPDLKDPVLILFNGGRNNQGLPILKVYGYSKGVNTGVYMVGVLRNGNLDVDIPVLAFDSAVGNFNLNIPGTNSPFKDRHGLDKKYVRTTCANGRWTGGSRFTLGTRDSAGNPTSPDSIVDAAPLVVPCQGAKGKGKFRLKLKGPSRAKRGRKATYRVTLKNRGTATARKVRLTAGGKGVKGRAKAGNIKPGKSKTVKIKVKFTKRGTAKVKFKASGKAAQARTTVKKVKVK
jgi:hypothetical protein